jgi:hypothetical protein
VTLLAPLVQNQIEASGRIHRDLREWSLSDAALRRLRETLPGFDSETCLLKSIAIDALYGTRVLAIKRMSEHVAVVMEETNIRTAGSELVERIASLQGAGNCKPRQFISFASKFCHFFVDEERFPIYDEAACKTLKLHLGSAYVVNSDHPYVAYCENLTHLRAAARLISATREIDRYLWITGMYMKWLKERMKKTPKMNVELQGIFKQPNPAIVANLDALLPANLQRTFKA